jgi:diguanylate cyclase (GGDEF)-like protein
VEGSIVTLTPPQTFGDGERQRDRALNPRSSLFLALVAAAAIAATAPALVALEVTQGDLLLFLAFAAGASISQLLVVKTPAHQAYYTTAVFFLAAALVLPAPLVILTVVVAHIPEWVRHRYPWYIQSFNIANYGLAAVAASYVAHVLIGNGEIAEHALRAALAGAGAACLFVLLNHALLAQMLRLARNKSYRESGLFAIANLATELVLATLGVGLAAVTILAPAFVPFVLAPLVLVHRALALPALEQAVRTDPKTGLYNARHFHEALDDELERARRFVRPLSVVLADLDLLRDINNTHGHLAGDAVICGVADTIKSVVRDYDVPARFGGEEFAIILPETGHDDALAIAERVRAAIEQTAFVLPNGRGAITGTISIGISSYPDHQSAQQLISSADLALYRAKALGRNQVCGHAATAAAEAVARSNGNALKVAKVADVPALGLESEVEQPASPPTLRVAEFVAAVGVVAAGVFGLSLLPLFHTMTGRWEEFIVFLALSVALQLLTTSVYGRGTEAPGVVGLLASGFVLGPAAAVGIAAVTAVVHIVRRHGRGHRAIFDIGNFSLSAAAAAYAFQLLASNGGPKYVYFAYAFVGGLVYKLVNVGLLCMVMSIDEGIPVRYVWRERFAWATLHYTAYGPLAYAAALAYDKMGVIGLLTFAVPPVLLALSTRQYLERTRDAVEEVREINERLANSNARVRRVHLETIAALSRSMEAKDDYSGAHIDRVRSVAVALGQKLGFEGEDLDAIEVGALMHDIGKIGIPEHILTKPGQLDDDEWDVMKRHPVISDYILSGVEVHPFVRQIVRSSHERIDGRGYPDGLVGEEVPLAARIVFVADAFDAITSDRPYRRGRSVTDAIEELRTNTGTQFCPAVVAALELLWRDQPELLMTGSERPREAPPLRAVASL